MSKILKIYLGLAILMASSLESWAYEKITAVDLGRVNATAPLYVLSNPSAKATLILLPGGNADTGKIAEGKPNSQNFLARSKDLFQLEGFNVVVMFRPTDLTDLETEYRVSKQHVQEIQQVIRFAKNEFNHPVWLVGTSRGTVSATASAIQSGDAEINAVRERAGVDPISGADINDLIHERRVELAGENERHADLIRWDKANIVDIVALYAQDRGQWKRPRTFTRPRNYYFPIPQRQIDLSNGVLVQNPNYQ